MKTCLYLNEFVVPKISLFRGFTVYNHSKKMRYVIQKVTEPMHVDVEQSKSHSWFCNCIYFVEAWVWSNEVKC